MNPPQRRQVERMRPSRAGSSSQSAGSVWVKQRAGFLAASNSAAVGFLASVAGPCPVVGVPVVPAAVAVEVPAAVPAVGDDEPVPASRLVEVLPAAVGSAGAGRVQSRCRSASNPAGSGVAVFVPDAGVEPVAAAVMAACSLSVFRVPCAAQGTRLWSLSGKGDTHAPCSVREMSRCKVTPTPPTS